MLSVGIAQNPFVGPGDGGAEGDAYIVGRSPKYTFLSLLRVFNDIEWFAQFAQIPQSKYKAIVVRSVRRSTSR